MKISNGILKKSAALSAAAVLGGATLPSAEGAVLTSMSQYDNAKALSANPMYKWSAAVQRTDSLGTSYAGAVMIAPDLFITAGHYTPRNGSLTASLNEIVLGANYNTSTDRYGVSHTERYPGYIFGNTSTIDLGVGWTSSFVNGFDMATRFASVPYNTNLTVCEYGNYGDITTGELPSLGDRLGGRAITESAGGSSYPTGTYFTTWFDGPNAADPLNVTTLNYASGSPWWTSDGALAGIDIAGTNTFDSGYSVVLNLSNPEVQSYLQPLIDDSWARYNASIPEPTTLALATLGVGALALRRRRKQ